MKDTKLIKLLAILSVEELKQVQKMVKSPYFTTNPNVAKLYHILRTHHPNFDSKVLKKQYIYKKIFFNQEYSDIKLRKLFSELAILIEEFIILSELEKENFEKKKFLLNGFLKRRSNELFEKEEKKIKNELDKEPYRDEIYFKNKFDLGVLSNDNIGSKDLKARVEVLEKSYKDLEYYYLITKGKLKNDLISLNSYINSGLSILKHEEIPDNIILNIFSKLELMYSSNDVQYVFIVKSLLEENINLIRKTIQQEILLVIINFSIKQMNVDDISFNDVALDLYKFGLEHSILINNNMITNNTFLNIVVSSAKAKNFDFAKDFINKYQNYLREDSKDDLFQLSYGYLSFYQMDYSKTVNLLSQYKFHLSLYDYSSKLLLIASYYELFTKDSNYFQLLESCMDSYVKWIQRNQLLDQTKKTSSLNFISIIRRLSKEKLVGKISDERKVFFLDLIANQNAINSKSWLINKVMS